MYNLCNIVIHTKCFKKCDFNFENNICYCYQCHSNKLEPCYNPYKTSISKFCKSYNYDEICYNEDPIDFIDSSIS